MSKGGNTAILLSHKINFCKPTRFRIATGTWVMALKDKFNSIKLNSSPINSFVIHRVREHTEISYRE